MRQRSEVIKPGRFGFAVAADNLRGLYDKHNEVLVCHEVPVDLVFIGDSITLGWNVHAYFARHGRFVVNRGIGGDNTHYALKRFAADVLQLKPKFAAILIGVNNIMELEQWVFEGRKTPGQIAEEVKSEVTGMIRLTREAGIVPLLCSILPTCVDISTHTGVRNEWIMEINAFYRKLAELEGGIYVDYHSRFTQEDNRTLRPELCEDGVHLNVDGYDIMADVMHAILAEQEIHR